MMNLSLSVSLPQLSSAQLLLHTVSDGGRTDLGSSEGSVSVSPHLFCVSPSPCGFVCYMCVCVRCEKCENTKNGQKSVAWLWGLWCPRHLPKFPAIKKQSSVAFTVAVRAPMHCNSTSTSSQSTRKAPVFCIILTNPYSIYYMYYVVLQ